MNIEVVAMHRVADVHALYSLTPQYFERLGTDLPDLHEVEVEVEAALTDPLRSLCLLRDQGQLIGYLDCKREFPQPHDLTINLLLIRGDLQRRGYGGAAVRHLERCLPAGTQRLLASVLGANAEAARFWERLGFTFAVDARPVMSWYAKPVQVASADLGALSRA